MNIIVLLSGNGSNLQAIIDAKIPNANIVEVISNNHSCHGVKRATNVGIDTFAIENMNMVTFSHIVEDRIEKKNAELIVLAGFMKILPKSFVRRYEGRILNIHPSLLPKYAGSLQTHQSVIENGDSTHGCSVHFVTPQGVDQGPIVMQSSINVTPNDTAIELADRVLEREHLIYPKTIELFVDGKLTYNNQTAYYNDVKLTTPIIVN